MNQKPKTPLKGALKEIRARFEELKDRKPSNALMDKLAPREDKSKENKKVAVPRKGPEAEL